MKFAKLLQSFEETSEEGEGFLQYKPLKKLLKKAVAAQNDLPLGKDQLESPRKLLQEEQEFVTALNNNVARINTYFMEKEEDAIIYLQALEDRLAQAGKDKRAKEEIRKELIDFHGEMVLQLHNTMINYAAIAKILKKHDKIMLHPLKEQYLAGVLGQPFLSTENISRLVREASDLINTLGNDLGVLDTEDNEVEVYQPGLNTEGILMKRTRAALGMLHKLQATAHTPSTLMPSEERVAKRQCV